MAWQRRRALIEAGQARGAAGRLLLLLSSVRTPRQGVIMHSPRFRLRAFMCVTAGLRGAAVSGVVRDGRPLARAARAARAGGQARNRQAGRRERRDSLRGLAIARRRRDSPAIIAGDRRKIFRCGQICGARLFSMTTVDADGRPWSHSRR